MGKASAEGVDEDSLTSVPFAFRHEQLILLDVVDGILKEPQAEITGDEKIEWHRPSGLGMVCRG